MARTVQIPKETILEAALEMVIRDGYQSINIKTLAKEVGCSTQPISWHFGNMEMLRQEVAQYAFSYCQRILVPTSQNGFEAFTQTGVAYVNLAFDKPNLFRFVYMGESRDIYFGGVEALIESLHNQTIISMVSRDLSLPLEDASQYIRDAIIYTHGLLTFVATGMMTCTKKEVMMMVGKIGRIILVQKGVSEERIKELNSSLRMGV